jgi:hypothetical protein
MSPLSDAAYWHCTMGCAAYPKDTPRDDCPRCGHPLIRSEMPETVALARVRREPRGSGMSSRLHVAIPLASRLPERLLGWLDSHMPIARDPESFNWSFWTDASYHRYCRDSEPSDWTSHEPVEF